LGGNARLLSNRRQPTFRESAYDQDTRRFWEKFGPASDADSLLGTRELGQSDNDRVASQRANEPPQISGAQGGGCAMRQYQWVVVHPLSILVQQAKSSSAGMLTWKFHGSKVTGGAAPLMLLIDVATCR
jgi:hypothetical protein